MLENSYELSQGSPQMRQRRRRSILEELLGLPPVAVPTANPIGTSAIAMGNVDDEAPQPQGRRVPLPPGFDDKTVTPTVPPSPLFLEDRITPAQIVPPDLPRTLSAPTIQAPPTNGPELLGMPRTTQPIRGAGGQVLGQYETDPRGNITYDSLRRLYEEQQRARPFRNDIAPTRDAPPLPDDVVRLNMLSGIRDEGRYRSGLQQLLGARELPNGAMNVPIDINGPSSAAPPVRMPVPQPSRSLQPPPITQPLTLAQMTEYVRPQTRRGALMVLEEFGRQQASAAEGLRRQEQLDLEREKLKLQQDMFNDVRSPAGMNRALAERMAASGVPVEEITPRLRAMDRIMNQYPPGSQTTSLGSQGALRTIPGSAPPMPQTLTNTLSAGESPSELMATLAPDFVSRIGQPPPPGKPDTVTPDAAFRYLLETRGEPFVRQQWPAIRRYMASRFGGEDALYEAPRSGWLGKAIQAINPVQLVPGAANQAYTPEGRQQASRDIQVPVGERLSTFFSGPTNESRAMELLRALTEGMRR